MAGMWRHVLLLFSLLLLGSRGSSLEPTNPEVPEEMQKSISTEVVEMVQTLEAPVTYIQSTLEVAQGGIEKTLKTVLNVNKNILSKVTKICEGIKSFCAVFSVFSGFLSLLTSFTTPSDLEVISEMFDGVNKKLDAISDEIDKLGDKVELQSLLSNFIPWQYSVQNGMEKLVETYKEMAKEEDIDQRRRRAGDFITFFEKGGIETNINNLIRQVTKSDVIQQQELFKKLVDAAECDPVRLTQLYLHLKRIISHGCQLILAYRSFKQMKPPHLKKFLDALLFIRTMYENRVWECKETTIGNSKKDIIKIVNETNYAITSQLKNINGVLSKKYPWYSWSIVNLQKPLGTGESSARGNQFYRLSNLGSSGWNWYVTWQGSNEKPQCHDIDNANSDATLVICSGCQNKHTIIANNMLSRVKCPNARKTKLIRPSRRRVPVYETFWVASGFKGTENPCAHYCNDHGECKVIPNTNQFQCFCHADYEGETCENKIELNQDITKLVSDLQSGYKNAFTVASLTNVLIQGENLGLQLQNMMQRINNQFDLTNILLKYNSDLQKLDYILSLSFDYSKRKISVDVFSRRMKNFLSLNSIHFVFKQYSNAILANGFTDIDGKDFFNTLKRMISSDRGACTKQYGNDAATLLRRLSRLDITTAQAILIYYNFESNYLTEEKAKQSQADAEQMVKESKERMLNFAEFWERTSCPPLDVNLLTQSGCSDMLSFEGMKVALSCDEGRAAEPQNIECINVNGELRWSATPRCVGSWSAWSPWTPCAATCGDSTQSRSRECNGEGCKGSPTDVRSCIIEDCCQKKYGKFKCKNNKCLRLSLVCNGNDDCGDGSDESKEICSYLRSGDKIALRNMASKHDWLSVRYTNYLNSNLYYGRAYIDNCIKGDAVTEYEWGYCIGHSMHIYGSYNNGKTGQPIRYGDKVAMYYTHTKGYPRWFICYTGYCMTYTCEYIAGRFDFGPKGRCKDYEFVIEKYDEPHARGLVKAGDVLSFSNRRGYLRGRGYNRDIYQDGCLQITKSMRHMTSANCTANGWKIFVMPNKW